MQTVIYAFIGYFVMLLTIRVLARRPGAQMTPFEFVLVFLIGGVSILAIMDDDRSLTNSVTGIVTVALLHRLVARLKQRFPKLGLAVDGTPLVVMENGLLRMEMTAKVRLHETDLLASARSKGAKSLDEVDVAVLERNGSISILKRAG